MKIEQGYLKKLLEAGQASERPTFDASGFDYNDPQFEFHMKILTDQGFIEQDDGSPGFGLTKSLGGFSQWSVLPLRLTPAGHQFIEALSNATREQRETFREALAEDGQVLNSRAQLVDEAGRGPPQESPTLASSSEPFLPPAQLNRPIDPTPMPTKTDKPDPATELLAIASRLTEMALKGEDAAVRRPIELRRQAAREIGKAWSGSSLGYHANVYYEGLNTPPPGARFSREWGFHDVSLTDIRGTTGDWEEFRPDDIMQAIKQKTGVLNYSTGRKASRQAKALFLDEKAEILSIVTHEIQNTPDEFLSRQFRDVDSLQFSSHDEIAHALSGSPDTIITHDEEALSHGFQIPPHIAVLAGLEVTEEPFEYCSQLAAIARRTASHLSRKKGASKVMSASDSKIFIGHGKSLVWRELKDFLVDRLHLKVDEFNSVSVAGIPTANRLAEMLDAAAFAFLIMTAEDEQADGKLYARLNVVHESGLFQGRLGFKKAIILLEEGCEEFSNIHGLGQIRFPKTNISAKFEEIRVVLEREGVITTPSR